MKALRYNKLLGVAMGERSLLIAEVSAGDRPSARFLAEFEFPAGVTLADADKLGAALGQFLQRQQFTARQVVVGLPAKWLLVKNKELPPVDAATAADLLRLGAETDFSSELKDLVFDYVGEADSKQAQTVLLIATPRRHIEWVEAMCDSAKISPIAITSSAAVLGALTHGDSAKSTIVLAIAANGAELIAHQGAHANMLRHLRAPEPAALFNSELRRVVSSVPTNGSDAGSEMVIWDGAGLDAGRFDQMGLPVRYGDLRSLGVSAPTASSNGAGRKYGAPVALAAAGLGSAVLPMDFLHSRLAPPPVRRVQRWMVWTGIGVLLLIGTIVGAYWDIKTLGQQKDGLTTQWNAIQPHMKLAQDFVSKVTFAQHWEASDPRYVACLRDVTDLLPADGQTYVTSLSIREKEQKPDTAAKANAAPVTPDRNLLVSLTGKAPNQERVQQLRDGLLLRGDWFEDVKLIKSTLIPGSSRYSAPEFSFTITFTFKAAPLKN